MFFWIELEMMFCISGKDVLVSHVLWMSVPAKPFWQTNFRVNGKDPTYAGAKDWKHILNIDSRTNGLGVYVFTVIIHTYKYLRFKGLYKTFNPKFTNYWINYQI